MGSCKECYHYEVCRMHYQQKCELTYETEKEVRRAMLEAEKGSPICDHFKDRSRFVELPCKVGDTVYAYPCSNYLHVIEDFIIDLVILVDRKNSVIGFRAGRTCEQNGRKCDIEFDLKDIGKTVFLNREEAEQALKLKERENNAN